MQEGRGLVDKADDAGFQVVHAADNLDRPALFKIGQNLTAITQFADGMQHIAGGHSIDKSIVLACSVAIVLGCLNRRLDLVQEAGKAAQLDAVNGAAHCATGCMPHDQNDFGAGCSTSKLKTANQITVGNIAGNTRIKGFANPCIQQNFRRGARVNATQNDRRRVCSNYTA